MTKEEMIKQSCDKLQESSLCYKCPLRDLSNNLHHLLCNIARIEYDMSIEDVVKRIEEELGRL